VKQAIAVKEAYPGCEVLNFYMDLRMFGSGYEELYQEAQEKYGITFIRGRVSEASQNMNGAVVLKAEDTLLGRPLKVTADWLVLLVGMEPGTRNDQLAGAVGVTLDQAGFLEGTDKFLKPGVTSAEGVFVAGACGGPASIPEAVNQGRAAAFSVLCYLKGQTNG
jgi:heterodisulfide reductase subunit A